MGVIYLYPLYTGEGKKRPFYASFELGLNFYDLFRRLREWKKYLNGNTDTGLNIVTWTSISMRLHQDMTNHCTKFKMQSIQKSVTADWMPVGQKGQNVENTLAESKFHIDKLVFNRKICKMPGIFYTCRR